MPRWDAGWALLPAGWTRGRTLRRHGERTPDGHGLAGLGVRSVEIDPEIVALFRGFHAQSGGGSF